MCQILVPQPSENLSSVQSLSHVRLFATSWTAARQASPSITNSWSLLKLMSIESVMPSSHLILCHPLLLLPSISPSISSVQSLNRVWLFVTPLRPHEPQHARPPCPSSTPGVYPNSCPLYRWYYPTVSSSVVPFSSCLQPSSIRGFSNESVLHIRWPKYWSFSFNISPSNEHSRLISFKSTIPTEAFGLLRWGWIIFVPMIWKFGNCA